MTVTGPGVRVCPHWGAWDVEVQPFQAQVHHAFGARKPVWRERARRVAEDVLAAGGGVPLMVFEALGLTRVTGGPALWWTHLEHVAAQLWAWSGDARWAGLREARDVVDWCRREGESPQMWRDRVEGAWRAAGVEPARDASRRAERDVLSGLGLREYQTRVGGRDWRVFAKRR